MSSFIKSKTHITVVFDNGESATVMATEPNYDRVVEAVKNKDFDEAYQLCSPSTAIKASVARNNLHNVVRIEDATVYYKDEPIHNTLTERMVEMSQEGFDIQPMVLFLENLMKNPSFRAVNELYGFLEASSLPITEDGHFLAYKRIKDNFTDIFTGTVDNSVGAIVEMKRNAVDENKDRTCSSGLHFCSRSYLPCYGVGPGKKTVMVKINPADVVAIPSDYNNAKGRTCRYEVIQELDHEEVDQIEGSFRRIGNVDNDLDEVDEFDESPLEDDDGLGEDLVDSFLNVYRNYIRPTYIVARDEHDHLYKRFPTIQDASRHTGVDAGNIRKVLKGERNTAGGFTWSEEV